MRGSRSIPCSKRNLRLGEAEEVDLTRVRTSTAKAEARGRVAVSLSLASVEARPRSPTQWRQEKQLARRVEVSQPLLCVGPGTSVRSNLPARSEAREPSPRGSETTNAAVPAEPPPAALYRTFIPTQLQIIMMSLFVLVRSASAREVPRAGRCGKARCERMTRTVRGKRFLWSSTADRRLIFRGGRAVF